MNSTPGARFAGLRSTQVQGERGSTHDTQCAGDTQAHDDASASAGRISSATQPGKGRGHRAAVVTADPRRISGVRREMLRARWTIERTMERSTMRTLFG